MAQNQSYRNNRSNTTMGSALGGIRGNIQTKRYQGNQTYRSPYPRVDNLIDDGIDHINVYEGSKTDLGKALAHGSRIGFNHKIFGAFGNMEAFWHYIQSNERDDRIRQMKGQTLKRFAGQMTRGKVTNFRAIIADSNYQKVIQCKEIVEELKASELPFDCYYINQTGLRQRHQYSIWLIQAFEEIRKAIKEDRKPNFDNLLDREGSDIYEFVIPEYLRRKLKEQEEKASSSEPTPEASENDEVKRPVASLFSAKPDQQPEVVDTTVTSDTPTEETVVATDAPQEHTWGSIESVKFNADGTEMTTTVVDQNVPETSNLTSSEVDPTNLPAYAIES